VPHPQVVVEQLRNLGLEAVELGQGVLADRDDEARLEPDAVDRARKLRRERPSSMLARVVEEVLLELVEDDEQRPIHSGARGDEHLVEAPGAGQVDLCARELGHSATDRVSESAEGVITPVAEYERHILRPAEILDVLACAEEQLRSDARAQQRALADAALAIK
jgi:hypothetical protein